MPAAGKADVSYRDAEGILRIVKDNLCHRCGACVGVCPVGTLDLNSTGYPTQKSRCIHCNKCVQACSGLEVDYEALGTSVFGSDYRYGALLGGIRRACIGYAGDPEIRQCGASGGVVTQLLAHLLETGRIQGALVATGHPTLPALGTGIIARTREQLLASAQSRYTTTPSMNALQEIQHAEGPFAMVGLPCQIHSLRKLQLTDERWQKKVPITIGLVCHYNLPVSTNNLLASLMAPKGTRTHRVQFRQKDSTGWPHNTLELTFSDGSKWRSPYGPKETFNVGALVSPLGRCLTCLDASAEFADLAVGDPWIRGNDGKWKYEAAKGLSAVAVRTPLGMDLVNEAEQANQLVLDDIPVENLHRAWDPLAQEKKIRVGLRIRAKRLTGQHVPRYKVSFPAPRAKLLRDELLFWLFRIVPSIGPLRSMLLRFWFSRWGVNVMRHIQSRKARKFAAHRRKHQMA